jgi:hypothetical protein
MQSKITNADSTPLDKMSHHDFIDVCLEIRAEERPDAGLLQELLSECVGRLLNTLSLADNFHLAMHGAFNGISPDGYDIIEWCIEVGADGRPRKVGERELAYEECEPFVLPYVRPVAQRTVAQTVMRKAYEKMMSKPTK